MCQQQPNHNLIFNASLALASILVALFTFLFIQTIAEEGYPDGNPYLIATVAVGALLFLTALISVITYFEQIQNWGVIEILFFIILISLAILPIGGVVYLF